MRLTITNLAIILILISLLLGGFFVVYTRRKKRKEFYVHIGSFSRKYPRSNIFQKTLKLTWYDINHHIHIIGQSGAGKSVLLQNIYSQLISAGYGVLLIDLKSDISITKDFKALLSERRNEFFHLDLRNPRASIGYNPLVFGNATELKDKIVNSIVWTEEHYKRCSEVVCLILMKALVYLRDEKRLIPTVPDLVALLRDKKAIHYLSDQVTDQSIKEELHYLVRADELMNDAQGLRYELELLTSSEVSYILTNPAQINLYDVITNKKTLLVSLDGQSFGETAKKIARMLISDVRAVSGAIVSSLDSQRKPKYIIIIDELADILASDELVKSFVGFLNRARGSGIGLITAHQSLGDFTEESTKAQVLDSTGTIFSFITKDPDSAEKVAASIGTKPSEAITYQYRNYLNLKIPTGLGSVRFTNEFIIHPNVIKNLNRGQAVFSAKKPSRYGVVKIDQLKIDHSKANWSHDEVKEPSVEFLQLTKRMSDKSASYAKTLKSIEI